MAKLSNLRKIDGGRAEWSESKVLAAFKPRSGQAVARPENPPVRLARDEPAKPVWEGYVDGLDPRWNVVGWVRVPARPERRLTVGLMAGDTVIATDTALRFRGDLVAVNYGDGHYGFHLAIPGRFFDGGRHKLAVRVLGEAGEAILGQLEITLPSRPPRRAEPGEEVKAANLVAAVIGTRRAATPAELETFAQELSEALELVARQYDAATAIGLLYVHVLRRRADEDGMQTRLTRLSRDPDQLDEVVREVVFSDEAVASLRGGAGLQLPALTAIRAWTRLRRFG